MKKTFLALALIFSSSLINAQLVTTTMTIQEYVQNVLLGNGISATNISYTGCNEQVVSYTNGTSVGLGIDAGLVLSTDMATNIADNAGFLSGGCNVSGEPDLLSIANSVPPLIGQSFSVGSVNDVSILEFDFIPTGDTLRFNYIFGSDEYMEWVNSSYNDIFAFFLSGPGITGPYSSPAGFPGGAVNIAQVPGSNPPLPITISSVNNTMNSSYYIDNPSNVGVYIDGYTVVLEAMHPVTCGETYHIKLAIADGSDGALESIVILEAGSFSSNAVVDVDLTMNAGGTSGNTLYENCGEATLTFTRPPISDLSVQDMAIITWTGTATNGVDYTQMPDTIFFPSGVSQVSFVIDAFVDGITEGTESVHMDILNLAACNGSGMISTFDFDIADQPQPIAITGYTSDICLGMTATLDPVVTGGYGNYQYSWSTGSSAESIDVSPLSSTTYYLTISDTCGWPGASANFPVNITVYPPFTVSIDNGDIQLDCGGYADVYATVSGGNNSSYSYIWYDENGNNLWGWDNYLYYGSWNGPGLINVQVTDGCGMVTQDTVTVTMNAPQLFVTVPDTVNAPCLTSFTIQALVSGGQQGYSYAWYTNGLYEWNIWTDTYTNPGMISEGLVTVQVNDACGQSVSNDIVITVQAPPLIVTLPDTLTGNCVSSFTLTPDLTGGGGGYTYAWANNGTAVGAGQNLTFTPVNSTEISIIILDGCGSMAMDTTEVVITNPPVIVDLGPDITTTCTTTNTLSPTLSGGSGGYSYAWYASNAMIANTTTYNALTPINATYSVSVTDVCNETDSDTINIIIPNPPLNITVSPDTSICVNGTATFSALATGGGGGFSYVWTGSQMGATATYSGVISSSTYTVTAEDQCGQGIMADVTANVIPVNANFDANSADGFSYEFVYLDTPPCVNCTYEWTFSDGSTANTANVDYTFDGLGAGYATLLVVNEIGCTATSSYDVTFPPIIYIPNCFTPNGDGINDQLQIIASSIMTFEMVVFNRWGDEVYRSTSVDDAWIGDYRGQDSYFVPDGAYNYVIKYKGYNSDAKELQGTIVVTR